MRRKRVEPTSGKLINERILRGGESRGRLRHRRLERGRLPNSDNLPTSSPTSRTNKRRSWEREYGSPRGELDTVGGAILPCLSKGIGDGGGGGRKKSQVGNIHGSSNAQGDGRENSAWAGGTRRGNKQGKKHQENETILYKGRIRASPHFPLN